MDSGQITVFIADDHVMVREGLAQLLSVDSSIRVVGQSGEGAAALEQVRQLCPDIVILDITMPGVSGIELCGEIAAKASKTRVLILTMHKDEQFILQALKNKARGYLLKDSAANELIKAVRAVARGELYLGPGVEQRINRQAQSDPQDSYENLTPRERLVLRLIAEGKTNRMISEQLGISAKTVDTHRANLMRKLGMHNKTSLVKYAIRRGIIGLT